MAKKHTYEAILPDGYVATRTTARIYTHVIAAIRTQAAYDEGIASYLQAIEWGNTGTGSWTKEDAIRKTAELEEYKKTGRVWYPSTWAGRPDLAEKAAATVRNYKHVEKVQIIPVTLKQ